MIDNKTKGHTALPINYVAGDHEHIGALWCKTHCIADVDLSPEWAERLTRAVNCHEDAMQALVKAAVVLSGNATTKNALTDALESVRDVLARAKEQTP